jgi:glycosyltransferase involved in cell wall biosynthesis
MTSRRRITIPHYAYYPAQKGGGSVKSIINFANAFGDEFDIFIITSDRDISESGAMCGVKSDCWVTVGKVQVIYLSSGNRNLLTLRRIYREIKPDLIYLNSYFAPFYVIGTMFLRRFSLIVNTAVVLAPRGEFSPGALALKATKKRLFVFLSSFLGIYKNITWHATNAQEADYIRQEIGTGARNIGFAPPIPDQASDDLRPAPKITKKPGHLSVAFLSRISEKKNLDGALKLVRELKGEIDFHIYGPKEDAEYWQKCDRIIKNFPAYITVHDHGAVATEDVTMVLGRHHLFFLPTHGENFGHVIFEALSAGCPVLISDRTAFRDLAGANVGEDLPLEKPMAFKVALQKFTDMGDDEWHRMRHACETYASNYLTDNDAVAATRTVLDEAIKRAYH